MRDELLGRQAVRALAQHGRDEPVKDEFFDYLSRKGLVRPAPEGGRGQYHYSAVYCVRVVQDLMKLGVSASHLGTATRAIEVIFGGGESNANIAIVEQHRPELWRRQRKALDRARTGQGYALLLVANSSRPYWEVRSDEETIPSMLSSAPIRHSAYLALDWGELSRGL